MSNPIDEWECDSCDFVTTSEAEYDNHIETAHNEEQL